MKTVWLGIMIKTSVQNVVKTVIWPINVTCLQENVMDGVKNDGKEILVIKVNNVYIQCKPST